MSLRFVQSWNRSISPIINLSLNCQSTEIRPLRLCIIPIVGSTRPERIKELALADTIELTREQWYGLYTAARKTDLP